MGLSAVKSSTKRVSSMPCGWNSRGKSVIRSTTLTTRTLSSGAFSRSHLAAATVSKVGMSPAQPRTTSGSSPSGTFEAHPHAEAPAQAMVGHREEAVGVGRQVDARDSTSFREHDVDQARPLVREAVVVVTPGGRGQKNVQGCHGLTPREVDRLLEPLGVLDCHGGRDHGEGLVGRVEPVTPAQEVALEPALAQMFAQDLEDPTVVGDVVVVGYRGADEAAVLDLEDGA